MPLEDHWCQCEGDNEYDYPTKQRQAPRRFYGRFFRMRHGQAVSEPEVVDDGREELWELGAATAETAWKYSFS